MKAKKPRDVEEPNSFIDTDADFDCVGCEPKVEDSPLCN